MANWPSYSEAYQGNAPTPDTGTMDVRLPPIISSAEDATLPTITATAASALPALDTSATGYQASAPTSGSITSVLRPVRSASRPLPTTRPAVKVITATVHYDDLTGPERKTVRDALQYPHRIRSLVHVFDGDEVLDRDINVADGQLDVDTTADVTRSISLTVVDPKLKFSFGPMGDVYLDRQISVKYGAEIREVNAWVEFDVFRGPVTGLERKGHEVTIEAQGKESLLLPPVKQFVVPSLVTKNERQRVDLTSFSGTMSFRLQLFKRKSVVITRGGNYGTANGLQNAIEDMIGRGQVMVDQGPNDTGFRVTFTGQMGGTNLPPLQIVDKTGGFNATVTEVTDGMGSVDNRHIDDYIRRVVHQYGEYRTDLSSAGNINVPKTFSIDPSKAMEVGVWPYLQQVADSVDMRLMYNGRGVLILQPYTLSHIDHVFGISDDPNAPGSDVLSQPSVRLDLTDVRNVIEVYGTDKNGHDVLKAREALAPGHPLSPQALGRHGVPRVLLGQVKLDQTNLETSRAHDIAVRKLRQSSLMAVDASFDALPMPYLEEWMTCRVKLPGVDQEFTLRKFSLPLGPASMSINYNRAKPVHTFRARALPVPHPKRKRKHRHQHRGAGQR